MCPSRALIPWHRQPARPLAASCAGWSALGQSAALAVLAAVARYSAWSAIGRYAALAVLALLPACSAEAPVIELRRVLSPVQPSCGAPVDARTMLVTALGEFPASESTARSTTIDPASPARLELGALPADTRVLQVEVLGSGGALRAIGRTWPFELDALADGARLSVLMAPPRGACPTGPLTIARAQPLVARAGNGVMIAGGMGPGELPVRTLELYQPATGRFEPVAALPYGTPELGLMGASMTALAGAGDAPERVVIAGGPVPAYQIYDPATGALSAELFLGAGRAHHAAVALDEHRVFLAGGCGPEELDARGACAPGTGLATSTIIDVRAGRASDGPALAAARIGGVAVRESASTILLIGGLEPGATTGAAASAAGTLGRTTGAAASAAPSMTIERIDLSAWLADGSAGGMSGSPGQLIPAPAASAAAGLAGGGVLAGFGPQGATQEASAAVLPPGASGIRPVTSAPGARDGVTMTGLEDGRVLIAGGAAEMLLYEPNRASFVALADSPRVYEHGAVLLGDGTVLVAGGRDATGAPVADAWVFRPDLTGPYTSALTVAFTDSLLAQHLVPRDPGQGRVVQDEGAAYYLLSSSGSSGALPSEWAVVAGPVLERAQVSATLRAVGGGGAAILVGFRDPQSYVALVVSAGQPATVYVLEQGALTRSCSGEIIRAAQIAPQDRSARVDVSFDMGADLRAAQTALDASIDGEPVIACRGIGRARGQVGIGVVGPSGAQVRLDAASVRR